MDNGINLQSAVKQSIAPEYGIESILRMIKFNVGHIIHLRQVMPIHHLYSIEVITGDLLVVTDQNTGHEESVNLTQFKEKFGGCEWERLEAIVL